MMSTDYSLAMQDSDCNCNSRTEGSITLIKWPWKWPLRLKGILESERNRNYDRWSDYGFSFCVDFEPVESLHPHPNAQIKVPLPHFKRTPVFENRQNLFSDLMNDALMGHFPSNLFETRDCIHQNRQKSLNCIAEMKHFRIFAYICFFIILTHLITDQS